MNNPGFAITDYHNTKDLYKKLDSLLAQPIRPLKRNEIEGYKKYFDRNCPKSHEITSEAMNYIPGGVQHNLAFNYPFPLVFTKAEGAYLYDKDGNKYIDFLQAGGPTVFRQQLPGGKR